MNLSIQRTDTRPKANRSLAWGLLLFVLAMPFGALGQIQFTEQAASKGVNLGGTKDGGLAFGDIDNDGDLDLIVNTGDTWGTTANTRVYLNSGPPNYTFTDVTASRCTQCLTDRNTERSVSFGDFNNDGYLDFVVNSSGAEKVFKNRGASQPGFFDRVLYLYADPGDGTGGNGTGLQYGNNTEGAGWFDYDGDGDLDLMFENHNWGIDILENRNFGEGVFQQVTLNGNNPPAPFTRVDGLPNTYSEGDYASITDYDDDGWVDLVCRKDWPGNSNNDFFRNTGPVGGFITFANGQNLSGAPNGNKGAVSMYDFDNDGDFDIAWTDGPNSNNRIYRNNAGTFASTNEPWASAGVTMPSSGLDGLACGDVDNDGDIDIFFGDDSGQSYLFLNQASNGGGMTFVRSNLSINPNANLEGCVFVDFDRDGDLDLYTNVNGGNNQLWVNNLNGLGNYPSNRADAYLMVRVWENRGSTGTVGQHADRPAHGAVLVLKDCNGNVISGKREVNGANGHGTQDPAIVHFGLKDGPNIPYVIEVGYPRYKNAGGTFDRTIVQYSVLPSTLTGYKIVDIYPNSSLPLASAGNGGPYTVGETIQLTASNGVSWSWAGPGGFTSTSQNPTRANATVAMAGTYTVTVTMVGGCTASATTTVAVSAAVPLCSGNTAEVFSIAAVAGATSYSWTLNGNASHAAIVSGQGTTALTVNLSSLAVGSTNTVCVTANNANCTSPPRCQAFTLPTSVSVSVAANPTTICTGGSSTLTATPSGGTTPYTYAWSGGGTASTNTVSPTATTTYTVTVTDAGGCTATATTTVTVVSDPSITAQPTGGTICAGGSQNLSVTATGGTPSLTYQWQYNNGGTWANVANGTPAGSTYSGQTTASLTTSGFTAAGSYQYRALVSASGAGCNAAVSSAAIITVVADPSVSAAANPTGVCVGGTSLLTATVSNGTGTTAFQWQSSANNASWSNITGATSATYTTPGITATTYYRVQITQTGNGCGAATSASVMISIATEDCSDNTDDDCDGFIDCADPECSCQSNVFPCDDDMYMLRMNPSNSAQTLIERLTIVGNTPTLTTLFTVNAQLNALAYYKGYLYCMDNSGTTIYRIDALGNLVNLGTVSGLPMPNAQWSGGTIDRDGNFYIIEGTVSPNYRLYKIPLLPGGSYTATQVVGSGAGGAISFPNNAGDIAIDETGTFYAWIQANATSTPNSGLYTLNLTTGVPTKVGSLSFMGSSLGSLFPAADGNLYGYGIMDDPAFNQKNFYVVDKTTGDETQIGSSGTSVGRSDGCSCPWRVTMRRSTTSTCLAPGGSVCWDFQTDNEYGSSIPGLIFRDTLDARFSYNFNLGTTQTALRAIYGNTLTVALTNANGGTNNVVTISNMDVPNDVATFQLCAQVSPSATFTANEIVYEQAYLTNLPVFLGSTEPSDFPTTIGPNKDASPVTISPSTVATASNTGPYCAGATIQLNSSGGSSYSWAGPVSFTSSAQNPTRASATTAMSGTYTVTVTNISGCTATATTTVTVVSDPSITAQPTGGTICAGGSQNLSVTATGGTPSLAYQWQYNNGGTWANVANGTPAGSTYTGATGTSLTVAGITAAGSYQYRALVSASGAGCNAAVSSAATITVVSDLSISAQPQNISECVGGTNQLSVSVTNGTGSITYQWQSSPNGTTWANVSGATSATYTPPSTSSGTTFYRVQIAASGGGCDAVTSNAATVTVNADPVATVSTPANVVCTGGSLTLTTTSSGGSGTCTFQWQSSPNGTTWTDIPGATGSTYTTSNLTSQTRFRVIYSCTGSGCCN